MKTDILFLKSAEGAYSTILKPLIFKEPFKYSTPVTRERDENVPLFQFDVIDENANNLTKNELPKQEDQIAKTRKL